MPSPAELRASLFVFAEAVGMPLTRRQAESLELRRRTTCVVGPRQSGKSRGIAVTALWTAFRKGNQHVLLISSGDDASKRLLGMCATAADSSALLGPSIIDEMSSELTLSNGSTIVSVPSSEAQIRGRSIDLLCVDEAALVDTELFFGAIWPVTAARPDAKVILASTPGAPSGPFHQFARAGESGDEHVDTFKWSLEDATWIEGAVVEAAREQLPAAVFAREFRAEFADTGLNERLIDALWIEEAQRREAWPAHGAIFGVDVARGGEDLSVMVELRGGAASVVFSAHERDTMVLASSVAAIVQRERGNPATLVVDEISLGGPLIDRLNQLGVPTSGFNASHRSPDPGRYLNMRASAFWELREAFRLGEVSIEQDDRRLAEELASLTYKITSSGAIQIVEKAQLRKSPDHADALCIAWWARERQAHSEQVRALLAEAQARSRVSGQREPSEELLALESGGRITEEMWSARPRERIVDSDLPVVDWGGH